MLQIQVETLEDQIKYIICTSPKSPKEEKEMRRFNQSNNEKKGTGDATRGMVY